MRFGRNPNLFCYFCNIIRLNAIVQMKKSLLIVLVILYNSILKAQNGYEQKYLLTTKTNTFGLSILSLTDPYLSPLTYSGNGIQYEHGNRRFLSIANTDISIQNKLDLEVGYLLNPAKTGSMTYMEI